MRIENIKSSITFTGRPYPCHPTPLKDSSNNTFNYPGYPGMIPNPDDKNPFGGVLVHKLNYLA